MSKTVKQIYSVALSATTIAVFSGAALAIPAISAAQTSCTFTRSLTVGSRGADVTCLQNTLVSAGHATFTATGYFGAMTKAAVAKWQAAAGISPAVGFFGPLSRAKLAMMVGGTTGTTGGTMMVPGAGVAVSLPTGQPMGSVIAGAGQIDAAKFAFTASNAAGATVTDLKFQRTGVVSDSNVSNMYLADESGVVIAQYSSLNQGIALFNGLNLMVNAGQTRVYTLRMDLSSGASAGNTLGWQLTWAKTAGDGAVSGLPLSGPTLTITTVSNPSLSVVTYTYVSTGTTVDAGTNGFRAHSATVNVTNSAVLLKSIKYTVVGSANVADLKNSVLKINGVIVASASMIGMDGKVVFIPSSDFRIGTGNNNLEIFTDIMGSPNRTMAWNVLRPYDAVFMDTQYQSNVTPSTSGSATTVTINQGRVTVSKASDTPTANIPAGASNVTLAKFTFYAGGEPVKVQRLPITITGVSAATGSVSTYITNVSVMDDVGNSVGTTISTPSGSWSGSNTFAADFGTTSSFINYIIPANTTRVLSVRVDVKATSAWASGATSLTSLSASLASPVTNNLEGQISFQSSMSGTATGNTLTVSTSPLTVATNPSFASPTYVAGANGVRVASFTLTSSSAEGNRVSSLTFDKDTNALFDAQNLRVMVGGTQFGTATSIVADTESALSFSGNLPILVPAGGSVTVDLFADILTSTAASSTPGHATVFDLTSGSAVGSVSNSSVTWPSAVDGQNLIIASGPTLTVAIDSDNVASRYLVMGSTDNVLYKIKLSANNTEDVRLTDITIRDTITNGTAGIASFNNLRLFDGDTLLAGPINMTITSATTGNIVFSLGSASSLIVGKNNSKTILVKGDVATFISGGAVSNSSHILSILATSSLTAYGKDSSAVATISGSATGTAQVIYRTKPTLTSSVLGSSTGRTRVAIDEIATLNWAANSADDLTLGTVAVKFSGQAASAGSTAFTVDLIDVNTNLALGSATQKTCTPGAGNSCTVSFAPAFSITRGTSKAVKLRVNSSSFFNGTNTSDSLSAIINAASDIQWDDGTTSAISWESVQIPITLVNVSYE